jgi:hypothetical protein
MLKNKKFLGKIQKQFIRVKSKPLIAEMGPAGESTYNTESNGNTKPALDEK